MLNVGDEFVVKSNGLSGKVIAVHLGLVNEYEVEWTHMKGLTHKYFVHDVIHEWVRKAAYWSQHAPIQFSDENTLKKLDKHFVLGEISIRCDHEWADYHGFKESFKFCKKCDKKE